MHAKHDFDKIYRLCNEVLLKIVKIFSFMYQIIFVESFSEKRMFEKLNYRFRKVKLWKQCSAFTIEKYITVFAFLFIWYSYALQRKWNNVFPSTVHIDYAYGLHLNDYRLKCILLRNGNYYYLIQYSHFGTVISL